MIVPVDVLYATQNTGWCCGSLMIQTFWNPMANKETSMSMDFAYHIDSITSDSKVFNILTNPISNSHQGNHFLVAFATGCSLLGSLFRVLELILVRSFLCRLPCSQSFL